MRKKAKNYYIDVVFDDLKLLKKIKEKNMRNDENSLKKTYEFAIYHEIKNKQKKTMD